MVKNTWAEMSATRGRLEGEKLKTVKREGAVGRIQKKCLSHNELWLLKCLVHAVIDIVQTVTMTMISTQNIMIQGTVWTGLNLGKREKSWNILFDHPSQVELILAWPSQFQRMQARTI